MAQPHKETKTGDIVTFDKLIASPLSVLVPFSPVQAGEGDPYPGGGSPQRWDEEWESGTLDTNGANAASASRIRSKNYISVLPETNYYFKASETLGLRWYDADKVCISSANTTAGNNVKTSPEGAYYLRFAVVDTTTYNHDISINYPSTDHDYHAWSNIRPISGWSGCDVSRTGKNLFGGEPMANSAVAVINNSNACSKGTDSDGDYLKIVASNPISNKDIFPSVRYKANTAYTVIMKIKKSNTGSNSNLRFVYTDGTKDIIYVGDTVVADTVYTTVKSSNASKTLAYIESVFGSGTSYIYYDYFGIFEGVKTAQDFTAYSGTTLSVNWAE